jgi:K+-transporting ATPase ATPase C chain
MARIAEAGGITTTELGGLANRHTSGRTLGFLGEPTVDVLALNLDLDRRYPFRG